MVDVILDRSIFHGDKFDLLRDSALLNLVRDGEIRVFFTPVFIEETLQFSVRDREAFKVQTEYLFQLNRTHWFRSGQQIVEAELGGQYVHPLYYLLMDDEISLMVSGVESFIEGTIDQNEFQKVIEDWRRNQTQAREFRKVRLEIRENARGGNYDFNNEFEQHAEALIVGGIEQFKGDTSGYLDRWKMAREYCPFTEQFLRCQLAIVYLPVVDNALAVHENDLADATQLAYLTWADMIVSDDTKFMKKAFDLLYGNSRKRILSSRDFLDNIAILVDDH